MSFSSLLNRTCVIKERSVTQNTFGEDVVTWTDKYTNVPCRMKFQRGREIANAGRDKFKTNKYLLSHHVVIIPGSYTMDDDYRIVIENENYEIIMAEKDSHLHHWVISIKKIT